MDYTKKQIKTNEDFLLVMDLCWHVYNRGGCSKDERENAIIAAFNELTSYKARTSDVLAEIVEEVGSNGH